MRIAPMISQLRTGRSAVLLFAALCALTGCLSRPALHKQTFAFGVPAMTATNAGKSDLVLGIRSLRIAALFDGRSFVFRTGEFVYERDAYAEFLEPPADELLASVRESLRRSGSFGTVVEAGSAVRPDTLVEISVNQLFGDIRDPKHPTAVLTVRFVFFDAPDGMPGKVIFHREYSRTMPLHAPTAAALMAGWNEALMEILAEVSADFRDSRFEGPKR